MELLIIEDMYNMTIPLFSILLIYTILKEKLN